jgi:hypothetical protein
MKPFDSVKAIKLLAALRMLHKTMAGLSDTELKELQVMPTSCHSWCAVMTVTPVPKQAKAFL